MSQELEAPNEMLTFASTRFGELQVPVESIIEFPSGIIGFPHTAKFVLIEHKHPFSWLHSIEDPNLAFVVVDGFEFGNQFDVKPPIGDKDADFMENDEYAILVIVTVRPDPRLTTANLKAPVFVNMRNRRGLQVIFDDPRYSTRFPLWSEEVEGAMTQPQQSAEGEKKEQK
jgi:flagellar assembly factor FliW